MNVTSRRERIASGMRASGLQRMLNARPSWHGLVVFNYHRIGNPAASLLDRNVFSGTQDELGRHIDLIRQHAELIAPGDVPTLLAAGAPRGRHVLITFDDGYRDNHELALPVLVAKNVRAAFFLNSGFMDAPRLPWNDEIPWMLRSGKRPLLAVNRWFPNALSLAQADIDDAITQVQHVYPTLHGDPARTVEFLDDIAEATGSGRAPADVSRDLWMTWDMARELRAAGMELGGHTVNHPALADETAEGQAAEITGVRDRLRAETGVSPTSFAYPYGGQHQFTDVTKSLLAEHGYSHAYSFYGGYNKPGATDMFDIRRVYMAQDTTDTAVQGLVTLPQLYGMIPPKLPWKR